MMIKEMMVVYAVINAAGFILMGIDKGKSMGKSRRVPEKIMLVWAMVTGGAGVLLGMVVFRHKTSKKKFYLGIPCIYLVYRVGIAIGILKFL